ncbi:cupin domain-containing protein [Methylomonas sp. AM2-LC]|uniref:cupin domain-containing protein n=1 Tax=Methylomonas sp. AM2-LC TaxID=3153301 RepID=UPI003264ABB5
MTVSTQSEQEALNRLIIEKIAPIAVKPERKQSMRLNLLNLTEASVARQAAFLTLRGKDGSWKNLMNGIRVKSLWNGPEGNSVLIKFAPGSSLLPHRHHWLEEGIVLQGELQLGDTTLGPLDYHVSPPGSRHAAIKSTSGALAYLRGTSLGDTANVLRELVGGVLPGTDLSQSISAYANQDWQPVVEGIQKKVLWNDGIRESGFYRLQAGAKFISHAHPLEEECLVVQGEVFLDDSLLCSGDYQLAPQGTQHDEVYTDVGALLFVRSAVN